MNSDKESMLKSYVHSIFSIVSFSTEQVNCGWENVNQVEISYFTLTTFT